MRSDQTDVSAFDHFAKDIARSMSTDEMRQTQMRGVIGHDRAVLANRLTPTGEIVFGNGREIFLFIDVNDAAE